MFDQDNKVIIVINNITDLVIMSCLWMVTCIPIFTIGAACASAYDTVIKVIRQGSGNIVSEYITNFRKNLRDTWLITLLLEIAAAALVFIAYMLWPIRGQIVGGIYFFMTCFIILTVVMYAAHLFCLTGRFTLDRRSVRKVALWMTFSRPLNNLLLAFVILGLIWMTLTLWQLIFILPGAFFWFMTYLEEPTFHRYLNYADDLKGDESDSQSERDDPNADNE